MAGFKADEAVPKLEWDFTRYVPKAKGVAPEPSTETIVWFQNEHTALVEGMRRTALGKGYKAEPGDDEDAKEARKKLLEHWAALTPEEHVLEVAAELEEIMSVEQRLTYQRQMAELIAKVTEENPSVEQMMGLPGRIRTAFYGWFTGQLIRPEV
jgi:hypothetical protein